MVNKMIGLRTAGLLAVWALLLVSAACSRPVDVPQASPQATAAVITEESKTFGSVFFFEGSAEYLLPGSEWAPVVIGMELPQKSQVRTGPSSYCEIQFGTLSVIRVSENTRVGLTQIALNPRHRTTELELITGSVVSKVNKLNGDDRYQIRTAAAVCGVRGTKFVVTRKDNGETRVAVAEGTVAVVPPVFDNVAITQLATSPAAELLIAQATDTISKKSPLVKADQEVVITPSTLDAYQEDARQVHVALLQAVSDMGSTAPGALPTAMDAQQIPVQAEVMAALEAYGSTAPAVPPQALDDSARKLFEETQNMTIPAADTDAQVPPATTEPAPDKVAQSSTAPEESAPATVTSSPSPVPSARPEALVFSTKAASEAIVGSVQAAKAVISATSKSVIQAISHTGKVLWSTPTDNGPNENSLPVLAGSSVYFAGSKNLVCLDLATGKILATASLDKTCSGLFGRRPAVSGNLVYLSSDTGLNIYDARTLEAQQPIAMDGGSDMTPAILGGKLYIANRSGVLHVIDLASASVAAKIATSLNQPIAMAPLVEGTTAVFSDRRGLVACVDIAAGTVLWEQKLDPARNVKAFRDPLGYGAGLYIFADNSLYGLSKSNGKKLFEPLKSSTGACASSGLLWYGTAEGNLKAMDPSTGATKSEYAAGSAFAGSVTGMGNYLAATTKDGTILLLNPLGIIP